MFYDDIQNAVLDHYNSSSLSINNQTVDLGQPAIAGQNETFTAFRNRAWVAYSASGDHTAPLLYVNYGMDSDYEHLMAEYGIDLNNSGVGYIGLAKRWWPWSQAVSAGKYGLRGLILFDDVYEDDATSQYPNSAEMPNCESSSGLKYIICFQSLFQSDTKYFDYVLSVCSLWCQSATAPMPEPFTLRNVRAIPLSLGWRKSADITSLNMKREKTTFFLRFITISR